MREQLFAVTAGMLCAVVLAFAVGHVPLATVGQHAAVRPRITVDAGHGGMDGGAVAPDGTEEKTLNLAIASTLADILRLCGCEVTMTRTDDTMLGGEADTVRRKKVADMQERLKLFEQADCSVSIHQNMFGLSSCRGSQVFYSDNNPLSKRLGALIREELITRLQPDNERVLKAGGKDIYLLHKTMRPAVLVECGFLSNADELRQLEDEAYQRELSFAIACGILRYIAPNGGRNGL